MVYVSINLLHFVCFKHHVKHNFNNSPNKSKTYHSFIKNILPISFIKFNYSYFTKMAPIISNTLQTFINVRADLRRANTKDLGPRVRFNR